MTRPREERREPRPARARPAQRIRQGLRRLASGLRQVAFGMTTYDLVREVRKQRAERDRLFVALTCGDLIGLPLHPTCLSLRLLPYLAPGLDGWRRSVSRQRDLFDLCGEDLS